jgi:hypothetical protein
MRNKKHLYDEKLNENSHIFHIQSSTNKISQMQFISILYCLSFFVNQFSLDIESWFHFLMNTFTSRQQREYKIHWKAFISRERIRPENEHLEINECYRKSSEIRDSGWMLNDRRILWRVLWRKKYCCDSSTQNIEEVQESRRINHLFLTIFFIKSCSIYFWILFKSEFWLFIVNFNISWMKQLYCTLVLLRY